MAVTDGLYRAVVDHDRRFDGRVYIGIRTTGIVCFPSCHSRTPRRDNIEVFFTVSDEVKSGYRPCKRCRPDDAVPRPPDAALAAEADQVIGTRFPQKVTLTELAAALYVSPRHLGRTLKRVWGMGLSERWDRRWALHAKLLLANPSLSIAKAAHLAGEPSPSLFSRRFRRIVGITPRHYRMQMRQEGKRHE